MKGVAVASLATEARARRRCRARPLAERHAFAGAGAVPVVDELVALPLDLYVKERGFTKIVSNLMAIG